MHWHVVTAVLTLVLFGVAAAQQAGSGSHSSVPRLYRVILPVADIQKATSFYRELLGMEGESVSPGRHYFHTGETILAIVDPRADGDDWDPRPNQDYVYFAVEDLESVHERATKLGGLSEEMGAIEKRPWGEVSFYMNDPFGNPLCFVDATTLFTGHERK